MFLESEAKRRWIRLAVWVVVLGLVIGVVSSLVSATGASAHAALTSASPRDGARLTSAPKEVVLVFSEPVSSRFATVTVTGPGRRSASDGTPTVDGATVSQRLETDLASGGYTVAFRVVSEDGHPVSGRTTFTLTMTAPSGAATPPSTGPPNPTPSPSTTAAPAVSGATASPDNSTAATHSPREDGRSTRMAMAVAIGALALAAGTALVAAARRRDGTRGH